jgi:Flp pilus assembly protein TadG
MNGLKLRSGRGHGSPRRRGQSLVEFALILPVFILILAGILDFGFMLYSRMTLISGTREAARWAVSQPTVTTIPTDFSNAGGHLATNLPGLVWGNTSYTATCVTAAGVVGGCDFAGGGQPNAVRGDQIRLSTTYVYQSLLARFFGNTVNLSAAVQMTLEVPQ